MLTLSIAEAAYIAGLFDGEGTVGYYRKRSSGCHVATLAIYNCDVRVMDWLRLHVPFGGVYRNKGVVNGWQWQLNSKRQIQDFLIAIRPYMIIKADQVDLLQSLWAAEQKVRTEHRLSNEVLALRMRVEFGLKSLKVASYAGAPNSEHLRLGVHSTEELALRHQKGRVS